MPAGREMDALVAEKVCPKCGGTRRMLVHKGKHTQCRDCHNMRTREWNRVHRKQRNPASPKDKEYRRKWALRSRYGLTVEQYQEMFSSQGGVCAICRKPSKRTLNVDHCHKTKEIRGLLCDGCNVGLSNFRDNINSLSRAREYLCAIK
jgi:hypothetical protein